MWLHALYCVQAEVFDVSNDADDFGVRIVFAITREALAKRLLTGKLLADVERGQAKANPAKPAAVAAVTPAAPPTPPPPDKKPAKTKADAVALVKAANAGIDGLQAPKPQKLCTVPAVGPPVLPVEYQVVSLPVLAVVQTW